jgi:hypothetical protein
MHEKPGKVSEYEKVYTFVNPAQASRSSISGEGN